MNYIVVQDTCQSYWIRHVLQR